MSIMVVRAVGMSVRSSTGMCGKTSASSGSSRPGRSTAAHLSVPASLGSTANGLYANTDGDRLQYERVVVISPHKGGKVSTPADGETRGPGRPRDPNLEARVFAAALAIYAEAGWSGFSFEAVARSA